LEEKKKHVSESITKVVSAFLDESSSQKEEEKKKDGQRAGE